MKSLNIHKLSIHKLSILIVIILSLHNPITASLKVERFSSKEGFNQNTITSITQDKYGFLWFATPNGLIKYDGYKFSSFNNDSESKNTVSKNNIRCLLNDNDGNLWIGGSGKVDVYVPQMEKFFSVPLESNIVVRHIAVSPKGDIWVAGDSKLFVCRVSISEGDVTFKISKNLLKAEMNISRISEFTFINSKSSMLISTSRGLCKLDIEYPELDSFPTLRLKRWISIFQDIPVLTTLQDDNIFWIGTLSGLYKATFDGDEMLLIQKFTIKSFDNRDVSDIEVLTILKDNEGSIWIGSGDEGIFKYLLETNSFENYRFNIKDNSGISSSRINSIFQDNFNVIWVGTAQGGINKLNPNEKKFITYSYNSFDDYSISGNLIMDILEDNRGKLWISTYNGSINRSLDSVDDKNVRQLRFEELRDKLPIKRGECIFAIFEDRRGFIWFSTESELVVFNPLTDKYKKVEIEKGGKIDYFEHCRTINQVDDENIIIGGDGIIIINNPWDKIVNDANPLLEASLLDRDWPVVYSLFKDSRDFFWIGTENGLFKCDYRDCNIRVLSHFKSTENSELQLSHDDVFTIYEDRSGNIWAGIFGGGLNKITINRVGEPIKIEYFRKNGPLPDDAVYGILPVGEDNLWLSTDMGLCRFDTKLEQVDLFDIGDGLANNNFRQGAYFAGDSGYLYFGGLNGLTIFKPESIRFNEILSKSAITGVSINNERVVIGDDINGKITLNESTLEVEEIKIDNLTKVITFHITAQHYATPTKNRLAYKLEGFDSDWIEIDKGEYNLTYTSLSPGRYILKIKSANGDGVWNERSRDLKLTVLPPWYKTWWSYTLFLSIVVGISVIVFNYLVGIEKLKQKLKFEQIDKKRIDDINESKLQFFTNISHEFRTPLTLITGPLENLKERTSCKDSYKDITTIQRNTTRLLNLVNQLITFRQADQGHLNLNLTSDTIGNLIYPVTEAFEDYAKQKNINFFYKINSTDREVVLDVEKMERIIFNLLSNSFKYTPENGNISIETDIIQRDSEKMVSIKVIDSGKGIPESKLDNIFERFYQLDNRTENVGGTGIGLAFCKTLINLMGGTISVTSEPNIRTCFTVLMPSVESGECLQSKAKSFVNDWIPISDSPESSDLADSSIESGVYTVLIVEDENEVREFLQDRLKSRYTVLLAKNGKEAFDKIKQNEIDLVVSDVMMPEMNGFELCKIIKSNPDTYHIPVILLTALGDHDNTIKGLEFGADDYMSKPFSPKYLEIRIQKLIENNNRMKRYFSKHSYIPDQTFEMSDRDRAFLNRVVEVIEKNISNSNFGVEELAQETKLSPSQFYRRLKQLTGQIPNAYLRNFRLQRAAELLSGSQGLNVTEVMYEIGMESSSYFSKSFKKIFEVTPSEYLKRQSHNL